MSTIKLSSAKTVHTNVLGPATIQAFKNRGTFQYLIAVKNDTGYRSIKANGTKIDTCYDGYNVTEIIESLRASDYHLIFEKLGHNNFHVTGFIR